MKINTLTIRPRLTTISLYILVILRFAIGWHFLYEGMVKLTDSNWTSAGYLAESKWLFSGLFHWIASNPGVLNAVDFLNIWGLILIGAGLMLGLLTRIASISGIVLIGLYFIASPPLISSTGGPGLEGHYLWVDKNLIELIALAIIALMPTGNFIGLDRFIPTFRKRGKTQIPKSESKEIKTEKIPEEDPSASFGRRELIRHLATLPFLGAFVYAYIKKKKWETWEEKHLLAYKDQELDAVTSATLKTFQFSSLKELKGKPPMGKIGNLEISRIFLGGNLIGGWAHARDLIYVSKLVKAYHHDQKVFETFKLAEACGINTFLTNPQLSRVINKYWRTQGGKIQFISDCGYQMDPITGIKMSIDAGAHACYVQGEISDRFVQWGRTEELGESLDLIRKNGLPAGIGAHWLETVQGCVEAGIKPDFWVKTLHHTNYWSAQPEEMNDNIWCKKPEATIEYMSQLEEPWIAFKVLAAGAIDPKEGFPYAFKNGADFICVGMYNFQIVEDVNLALEILNSDLGRQRPWRA